MRTLHGDEGGQAIVLIGIVLLGMITAVGLAMDAGQLYNGRRTAQEAADAGAFAGAVVLFQQGTVTQATSAATSDANLNGYCQATSGLCSSDAPTSGTTVTVSSPPSSGAYAGNALCVQVVISTPVKTSLVPQQSTFSTVTARGTACSITFSSGYAMMALDQNCDSGTIKVQNNGSIIVHNGSIEINSCSSTAGSNTGTVTLDAGYETDVVGNASGFPNTHSGYAVQADPFAGTPKPSTSGLTGTCTQSSPCTPTCTTSSGTINQPGVYTGSAGSNCEYDFAPGTYIFEGGSLDLQGTTNASACTGTTCTWPTTAGGVFFFFTMTSYPATGGYCSDVVLNGKANTTLSAPTSGTYKGMLMWIDNNCTNNAGGQVTGMSIGGNGAISATGSIYVPSGTVSGNGNNSVVAVTQIIANQVNTQNADFTMSYSAAATFQGQHPALAE